MSDPLNCGRLGNVCPTPQNSFPLCSAGICTSNCTQGFSNCDGLTVNGCEVDTTRDVSNCGACGNACSLGLFVQSEYCNVSSCFVSTCKPNYHDYDGLNINGCESPCVGNNCTIEKVRRFNGPIIITLANMQISTGFAVTSLEQKHAAGVGAQQLQIVNGNIQFTISPALSGIFTFQYTMTFTWESGQTYTLYDNQATFNVVNHPPVLGNTAFTLVTPRQSPFVFKLLDGASDIDGDSLSVVKIMPKKNAPISVKQIDNMTLCFVEERVFAQVYSNGTVVLSQAVFSGDRASAGDPLSPTFHKSIGFQYQVSDGDRDNQYEWGIFSLQP
eukprot:TRINITY_DN4735_c0_g1_i4.p1 TRINITY_DN4735_c0_g1~~TRINITY_DN4735_c0_g1_i4.p1  ORF type:complete len:329 (-),score=49.04 TRINITY_DN4735_c0_g1_i4:24-1010(-)